MILILQGILINAILQITIFLVFTSTIRLFRSSIYFSKTSVVIINVTECKQNNAFHFFHRSKCWVIVHKVVLPVITGVSQYVLTIQYKITLFSVDSFLFLSIISFHFLQDCHDGNKVIFLKFLVVSICFCNCLRVQRELFSGVAFSFHEVELLTMWYRK